MLSQPTLEKLKAMKLSGMARALEDQFRLGKASDLSFEERWACWWTVSMRSGACGACKGVFR
jgi:hypothetical protein